MGYENYINSMAENFFNAFEEMTAIKALGFSVEEITQRFKTASYKTAIVIPFENRELFIEGRFLLGLNDEDTAVVLASAIADNIGMPAVDRLDEAAADILAEFMNTVAGMVITEWDKMGLTADFSAPEFTTDLSLTTIEGGDLMIHAVTLHLPEKKTLTILAAIEETPSSPLKNKKVLVVDDSKMVRHILEKEFKNRGCQVCQAENGMEAVVKTKAFQPDLIIMDLVMPKMGGLEAIGHIRELDPSVHIIVLTSSSKKDEVLKAAGYKVKGYIRKPIKMDHILELAKSCFSRS